MASNQNTHATGSDFEPVSGENTEHNAIASLLPPELILLILQHIPCPTRPQIDSFSITVSASSRCLSSSDAAILAAPLICSSWRASGTEVLYERINIYTESQCSLLHRTLHDNPSLRGLIRFLNMPRSRKAPEFFDMALSTPCSVLQVSTAIVASCTHVEELDVLQQDDSLFNTTVFPNLRFLRVSSPSSQLPAFGHPPLPTRFPVLQELTLHGYNFDSAEHPKIDAVWPELSQLKSLRLEHCVLEGSEDLIQILSRTKAKLQSLALFSVRHPFGNFHLPPLSQLPYSCLEILAFSSLKELWIEDCGPLSFERHFPFCSNLRSLHIDWHLFAKAFPFVAQFPQLFCISIAIPVSVAHSAPNYGLFEENLDRLPFNLPKLKNIRLLAHWKYPPLGQENELRRRLGLRDVRLEIDFIYRGEVRRPWRQPSPPSEPEWLDGCYPTPHTRPHSPLIRKSPTPSELETEWHEGLYI